MSAETFTLAVVAAGILLPLSALAAAELQRRFGGRRAAAAARVARTRAEASRVAAARVARLRDEARGERMWAAEQRRLAREQAAAAELSGFAERAAAVRPRPSLPAAATSSLTPMMRAALAEARANVRALEAA